MTEFVKPPAPVRNPSPQKGGRTLQGRDQSPGMKGKRPVMTPRLDQKQRKSLEAHRKGGR